MADGVGEVMDIGKDMMPKLLSGGGMIARWGLWLILFIIFTAVIVLAVWLYLRNKKFNKIIVIWEKIGGRFEETRYDKAMEVKFSTAGDTIFYLRKHKKYLPNPTQQVGRRKYWYFIDPVDNEWINFAPGDFHEDRKKLGAHILHTDMRYARTQVQKGLRERYDKPGFWKQYGLLVFSIAFIVIIAVMALLLFDKWTDLANTTVRAVEVAGDVMVKIDQTMGSLDRICSGSGMRAGG